MFFSGRKISGGETVVTESDVSASEITGGSIVVSGGDVNTESFSGGAIILARGTVHIKYASSAGGPVAASNVIAEQGTVNRVNAKEILNNETVKSNLKDISAERERRYRKSNFEVSNSRCKEVKDILGIEQGDGDTGESKHRDIYNTRREEKSEEEDDDDDTISTDMSDDELAIVVVSEVLGLLSEDNERYYRDKLILVEQYPELESVFKKADSTEDVTQITEEVEGLDFSDDQIRLMERYQDKLDDSVSLKELEY